MYEQKQSSKVKHLAVSQNSTDAQVSGYESPPSPQIQLQRAVNQKLKDRHVITSSDVVQRAVIPHKTFLAQLDKDVYENDSVNLKLGEVWEMFRQSPQFTAAQASKKNVYVTSTGKETAAYIRTVFDTENFKDHVGALAEEGEVDMVVNINPKNFTGLSLDKSEPIGLKEDDDMSEFDDVTQVPAPSKMPLYFILTHEFGHIGQFLSSPETEFDEFITTDKSERDYGKSEIPLIGFWKKGLDQILLVASAQESMMLTKFPNKFKLMLLADMVDGVLMKRDKSGSNDNARKNVTLIKWYLTIGVEYENMILNEIFPMKKRSYAVTPARTKHGIENQLHHNLPSEEAGGSGSEGEVSSRDAELKTGLPAAAADKEKGFTGIPTLSGEKVSSQDAELKAGLPEPSADKEKGLADASGSDGGVVSSQDAGLKTGSPAPADDKEKEAALVEGGSGSVEGISGYKMPIGSFDHVTDKMALQIAAASVKIIPIIKMHQAELSQ